MISPNFGSLLRVALALLASCSSVTSWKLVLPNLSPKLTTTTSLPPMKVAQQFAAHALFFLGTQLAPIDPVMAEDRSVYFGVGCFWHVQHEFVQAEKNLLKRSDDQLTSVAGYAGSTQVEKDAKNNNKAGLVCYHNRQNTGDYGKLGHGEVVGMTIPEESYKDFAKEYFALFGKDLERPDKLDRGPEYRSLVGLPGGINSKLYPMLEEAAKERGLRLAEGVGSDDDTLGKKLVWVMDSDKFPFYQAEVYHQFHDGFMIGEQYPSSYNGIAKTAYQQGLIKLTGCPDAAIPEKWLQAAKP